MKNEKRVGNQDKREHQQPLALADIYQSTLTMHPEQRKVLVPHISEWVYLFFHSLTWVFEIHLEFVLFHKHYIFQICVGLMS